MPSTIIAQSGEALDVSGLSRVWMVDDLTSGLGLPSVRLALGLLPAPRHDGPSATTWRWRFDVVVVVVVDDPARADAGHREA